MRGNRGSAIAQFFEDLDKGDPVAVGFVVVIGTIALALGLFVLKVRRDLRKEDEKRAKRYGRQP